MASQKKKNLPAKKEKKMTKKTKRIIVAVSIVVMALVLVGGTLLILFQSGVIKNSDYYKKLAADRKTVATCNGFEIPYEELRFLSNLYKDSLEYAYGEGIWDDPATAEQYRAELESLIMANLNENYLILSACKTLSIPIDSDEKTEYVDAEMEALLKQDFGGDKQALNAWIEEQGMTEHYLRFCIGVEFLHSTIYYTLKEAGFYSFDTDNLADFIDYVNTSDNYAHTIHVYVQNDEGDDVEANRRKAQTMHDHLEDEINFPDREALMREYIGSANNEDLTITKDGYYFTYGEMDETYEEASFGLSVGEISEVIETSSGFYVIMRLAPDPDYVSLNAQTLLTYYQSAVMGSYIEGYDEQCTVVLNEYGKSLDLVNLE